MEFDKAGWVGGWYVVPYRVPWRDVDAAGHVNNAIYFSWFEWARTRYWLDLRGRDDWRGIDFIVARAECNFRRQVSIMDRVELRTRISEIRNSSLNFEYQIVQHDGGELAADGNVVVVLFDWDENRKKTIDDDLRNQIRTFQKE